jgi:ATP-dependent DNA helicase RecQ
VGRKKLERYGALFLGVISSDAPATAHPSRVKLAGQSAGTRFDRLQEIQRDLQFGQCGTLKPLSCTPSQIARVAKMTSINDRALVQVLGDKRAERFGPAFIEAMAD